MLGSLLFIFNEAEEGRNGVLLLDEAQAMLSHRCEMVEMEVPFPEAVIQLIYDAAREVPRYILRFCDGAFAMAQFVGEKGLIQKTRNTLGFGKDQGIEYIFRVPTWQLARNRQPRESGQLGESPDKEVLKETNKSEDAFACPDCHGTNFWYPSGTKGGVAPVSSSEVEFRLIREVKRIELNVGKRTAKGKFTLNSALAYLKKASPDFVS